MANEKRLIDANALRKEIDLCDIDTFADKQTICEQIADAPTVDAVEVVRCKDCKYQRKYHQRPPRCYCLRHEKHTLWDDFCSYGERREGE